MRLAAGCCPLVACCFFGALPTIAAPATAQTIAVRLSEIFHPQNLEISSRADQPANGLKKRESTNNFLVVSPSNDMLQSVRINFKPPILQMQIDGKNRALSSNDTLTLTASNGYFFVKIYNRQNEIELSSRQYSGSVKIYVRDDELCIINTAPVDDYLAGVLAAEMPPAKLAALQAQAVVSRTYMRKNWQRHRENGYQFCDLTHCQTYKGSDGVTDKIKQAVAGTADEILMFAHQPIEAYYSSTCGGRTADGNRVWGKQEDRPYFKSVADEFCAGSPHYRWRVKLSADSLHQIWQQRLGEPITTIAIAKKGADGRVRELALMGNGLHLINGEDFRAVTCRVFGWNTLKSVAFDFRLEKNNYVFAGRGLGHGLGLCQYGAMEMARRGYSYREILRHYFSKTKIQKSAI
jgi:SpoIID/LytB domain protein